MRRADRQVDLAPILAGLLDEFKVIRIGCHDEQGQYIVPLSYGYEISGSDCEFYVHSASAGRKVAIFEGGPVVAFELDGRHKLTTGATGCDYSFNYISIIGEARVEKLQSEADKIMALDRIMAHYEKSRMDGPFAKKMVEAVNVYRLKVVNMTGKQRNV